MKVKVCKYINENLNQLINTSSKNHSQIEDMWQNFKSADLEPCKKHRKPEKRKNRKLLDDWWNVRDYERQTEPVNHRQRYKEV